MEGKWGFSNVYTTFVFKVKMNKNIFVTEHACACEYNNVIVSKKKPPSYTMLESTKGLIIF